MDYTKRNYFCKYCGIDVIDVQYCSNDCGLQSFTNKLNKIAKSMNTTVPELLQIADSSSKYNKKYMEAMELARGISFFKRKM